MIDATADHPNRDDLLAFGQGRLPPEAASTVEEHLAHCRDCCERLEDAPADSFLCRLRASGSTTPEASSDPGAAAPSGAIPADLADNPRYRVLELIGRGGMGAVYRAEHRRMERLVALKVIHPRLTSNPDAVLRFRQEVRAAARLDHENIVTAHDADQAGGLHFLVMEYVEGTSLAEWVAARGPLPVADACECVRQAALGLQHAHEQGLVHRDIKPHNLMLTPEGRVKILDFGLARLPLESGWVGPGGAAGGSLTGAGALMGTADYISPEQAADPHAADIRADIYSLGCTLFHLLAGRAPFPHGGATAKLERHAATPLPSPRRRRPEIPAALDAVLCRMTAKEPADRYATPAEVARALAPFCRPKRTPRVGKWLLAAGLVAGVAAVPLCFSFMGRDSDHGVPPGGEPIERPGDHPRLVERPKKAPDEAGAVRLVAKLGGWVRRDESIPGKPVTIVTLAGKEVTDVDLEALAAFERLDALDLASTPVSDAGMRHLAGLKHLKKLVLVGTKVGDEGMKVVGGFVRLEDLELQLTGVGDGGIRHLNRLTNLRQLSLHRTAITDAAMADVAKMKGLTHLTLSETNITDEGLKPLTGLTKLTQLGLFHAWRVGDEGMKSVVKLQSLRVLDLCGTKVGERGLKELAGCAKLTSLRVGGLGVTDAGVAALAGMADLAHLDLSNADITDAGVAAVARHRRLTGLDLRGAKKVTDAGVTELAGLPALDNLVLSGTAVTDAGLAELGRCPRLSFLGLRETPGVTADGVKDLRAARPGLQIQR